MNIKPQFQIPKPIKVDTEKYKGYVKRYLQGKLSAERFKGYRVPMGVYGQRGAKDEEKYMIRVRMPGGVVTKQQLQYLGEISRKYGKSFVHLTTRQDIQIHQVDIEDTPEILFKLLEVGLSPRGGGGNTVRNIANSARAGVNPEEPFDTTPYALALSEYLLTPRSSFNLPRKYKIAFSSTPVDGALATVNDLGFIAKKQGDRRGFKVYAAGGMGNAPEIAFLLEDFIAGDKIFHVAEAIKRLFDDYGDRSNKHKARLRFVRNRLGEKEFKSKYKKYLNEVLAEGIETRKINHFQPYREKLSLSDIPENEKFKNLIESNYIYPEKIEGYYSLELRPENGDLNYQEIQSLLALPVAEQMSIRTTNKQGLLIRGIKAGNLVKVVTEISKTKAEMMVESDVLRPVACKGASTCRLGLCLSPGLAEEINKKISDLEVKLQDQLPQIYISGCPNSCGQHYIGRIGFEGKAKRYKGKLVPHYSLLLGGQIGEDQSQYGEKIIDIPARRIPEFLAELARTLAADENYEKGKFNDYVKGKNREKIINLARKYTELTSYEQEPELYKDWGQEGDFSLAGRGPGECGTGVLEIVKLDLDTAKNNYETGVASGENEALYQAIINATRALLIVRGVDTEKDRVIINRFREEFINKKLVAEKFTELLHTAIDYKLGDENNLLQYQKEIEALIKRVEELFNSLNAKLEFKLEPAEKDVDNNEGDEGDDNEADGENGNLTQSKGIDTGKREVKTRDLRGVECPLNFVKAKLFIEPLPAGEVVDFYLDEGEPIKNVPQSLEAENHEILAREKKSGGYYLLKVKKGD